MYCEIKYCFWDSLLLVCYIIGIDFNLLNFICRLIKLVLGDRGDIVVNMFFFYFFSFVCFCVYGFLIDGFNNFIINFVGILDFFFCM